VFFPPCFTPLIFVSFLLSSQRFSPQCLDDSVQQWPSPLLPVMFVPLTSPKVSLKLKSAPSPSSRPPSYFGIGASRVSQAVLMFRILSLNLLPSLLPLLFLFPSFFIVPVYAARRMTCLKRSPSLVTTRLEIPQSFGPMRLVFSFLPLLQILQSFSARA